MSHGWTPANVRWSLEQANRSAARDNARAEIRGIEAQIRSCREPNQRAQLELDLEAQKAIVETRTQQINQGNSNFCVGTLISAVVTIVAVVIVLFILFSLG